jgi:molybdenum cofactor synthesis domain-containing protein
MEDRSGPAVAEMLQAAGFQIEGPVVVADERNDIVGMLVNAAEQGFSMVATTGGTGVAARDVTPQATLDVVDYQVPGLAEQMRRAGVEATPLAMLSREVAGVRGRTLIVNLPGSAKGAIESLNAILPALPHAIRLLRGETDHAAAPE